MIARTSQTRRIEQPNEVSPHSTWGDYVFPPDAYFLLHIGADRQQLIVPRRKAIFIGRTDELGEQMPDIDLAPYQGAEHGVSRLHAVLGVNYNRVTITDFASSNGVWLNGVKLEAHQPSLIRAGDDIRFGSLIAYIYFMKLDNPLTPDNGS